MQHPFKSDQIGVVLVEDDVFFQDALRSAIQAASDMALLDVASTRAQGMRMLEKRHPDVLLVDLGLPDGSGVDVIRAAREMHPACNIMVCTTFGDEVHVMQSLEAGATGYLLKDSDPERMVAEIRSLHAGGSPISPLIARQILTRFRQDQNARPSVAPPSPDKQLSARESEVLGLVTKGFTADEIAELMQVSRHTVLTYIRRVYAKLQVNSKAEAIYEAHKLGLLNG